jgi:hypothetical protein
MYSNRSTHLPYNNSMTVFMVHSPCRSHFEFTESFRYTAMTESTLVDVRIMYAYQNERDGLQTVSIPVMVIPACASCCGICDQQPCVGCAAYICSACAQAHACCCSWCGALSAFSCNLCALPLCAECAPEHNCSIDSGDASSATSDCEPEGEPVGETGDATWLPRSREPTYAALRELWAPRGTPMARLEKGMWVEVACAPQLCLPWTQAGRYKSFGEDIDDFVSLCEVLAGEFPKGAAIVNLDKKKTTVCVPGQATHTANVTSALSWLRYSRGQTFGLALCNIGGRLQGAFLEVLFHPRLDRDEATRRRRTILEAVTEIIEVT